MSPRPPRLPASLGYVPALPGLARLAPEAALRQLGSTAAGLSEAESGRRLALYGHKDPAAAPTQGVARRVARWRP